MILGSKSPRRQELLKLITDDFRIETLDVDETVESYSSAKDYATQIAEKKIKAYLEKFGEREIIICADTIVVVNDLILEKPKDRLSCYQMIKNLENTYHYVYTTFSISYYGKINIFREETKVYVDKMTDEEIYQYIDSEKPYDKAGGYGIQGEFCKFISKIEGDYYNVMGLPVSRLYKELKFLEKSNQKL